VFLEGLVLALAMDQLVDALTRDAQILGDRLQGFTSSVAFTDQSNTLVKGRMFPDDRSLGEGIQ
jgi:hypothetical protein